MLADFNMTVFVDTENNNHYEESGLPLRRRSGLWVVQKVYVNMNIAAVCG